MTIYGYIRVSTDKQTTENQRFEIKSFCDKINVKIDKWINETISGNESLKKRKLGQLLKNIKKGDTIICTELSRFSRDMFDMMAALGECDKSKVNVISIKEHLNMGMDDQSRILVPIYAMISEFERNKIAVRTKIALDFRKASGVKLGRPVGSKSKNKKLDGKEDAILQMRNKNMSHREIAKKLKVSERSLYYFLANNDIFNKKIKRSCAGD